MNKVCAIITRLSGELLGTHFLCYLFQADPQIASDGDNNTSLPPKDVGRINALDYQAPRYYGDGCQRSTADRFIVCNFKNKQLFYP